MPAEFIALAETLRARAVGPPPGVPAASDRVPHVSPLVAAAPADAGEPSPAGEALHDAVCAALRDARLFRARLADALDAAVPALLRELATRVLGRELRLEPTALEPLLRAVLAATPGVRVRVAPEDVRVVCDLPLVADASLAPGDALVELDGGDVDARLGTRLAVVLDAFA